MKRIFWLLILFLLSRLLFVNDQLLFMDSHEYLARLTHPYLLEALTSGHPPLHAGYILTLWPMVQLGNFFQPNSILLMKTLNVFLSLGTVWLFYLLAKTWISRSVALWAAVFVALSPLFWITTPTLLAESTYLFWFLLALFGGQQFFKTRTFRWLGLSCLALFLAVLTHPVVLIFLPAFGLVLTAKNKHRWPMVVSAWLLGFLLAQVTLAWLYTQQGLSFSQALILTFTSKLTDLTQLQPWPLGLARTLRNWIILSLRSFTPILIAAGAVGLCRLAKASPKKAFGLIAWFLPSALAAQWWDGLLAGRHLLLAVFPLSLAAACLLERTFWRFGLTAYLFLVSLGAVWLLTQPVPAQQPQQALEKLPTDGLIIDSHFSRPWLNYLGTTMYVNKPGTDQNFSLAIDQALAQNQPVFIASQALTDPYGVYTGPYLHPLSLGFRSPPKLNSFMQSYRFIPVATPSAQDHLTIYQVTAESPRSGFRPDSVPAWHRRRLDFFDPVSWFWFATLRLFKPDTIGLTPV